MLRSSLFFIGLFVVSTAASTAAASGGNSGNADDAAAGARMREQQRRSQAAYDASHSTNIVEIFHSVTVANQIAQSAAQQRLLGTAFRRARMTSADELNIYRPMKRMNRYAGGPPKLFFARDAKAIIRVPIRFRPTRRVGGIVSRIGGSNRSVSFDRLGSGGGGGSFNFQGLSQGGPSFSFGLGLGK